MEVARSALIIHERPASQRERIQVLSRIPWGEVNAGLRSDIEAEMIGELRLPGGEGLPTCSWTPAT